MANSRTLPNRGDQTRHAILDTAERLFAERGIHVVSNRQIGEAAGQGNTAVVGYHFGTKADLVLAIMRRHTEPMERTRARMVAEASGSTELRDWVACLVRPRTEHLAALGSPTWFARFCAQVTSDPALREVMIETAFESTSLPLLLAGLNRCLPGLPADVHIERSIMAGHLVTQMCVERERALADGTPTLRRSWGGLAESLVDAIAGLWLAPVTRHC